MNKFSSKSQKEEEKEEDSGVVMTSQPGGASSPPPVFLWSHFLLPTPARKKCSGIVHTRAPQLRVLPLGCGSLGKDGVGAMGMRAVQGQPHLLTAFPLPPAASPITEFMASQMSLLPDASQNCLFSSRKALWKLGARTLPAVKTWNICSVLMMTPV